MRDSVIEMIFWIVARLGLHSALLGQLGSFGLPLLNSRYSSHSRLCLTAALAVGDLTQCLQLTVPKGFKSLSRTHHLGAYTLG